jgi:hypothetical protein
MINFFRKIRKKLADDNKPLKYARYAIGEIVLVVIGILIALSINNWSENRKNRKIEQIFLKSLLVEMKVNYEQLNEAMGYHLKSRNAAKRMIEIYNGDYDYKNYQEIDSVLALLQWAWTFDSELGALNSIKTSGLFNSIQNESLRSLISSYEDLSYDAAEEGKLIQKLIIDKYVPSVNQYVSINQRLKYLGEDYYVGESHFKPDYEGLFEDRNIESLISYIHTWRIDEFKEEKRLKLMIESFISTLNKELDIVKH